MKQTDVKWNKLQMETIIIKMEEADSNVSDLKQCIVLMAIKVA